MSASNCHVSICSLVKYLLVSTLFQFLEGETPGFRDLQESVKKMQRSDCGVVSPSGYTYNATPASKDQGEAGERGWKAYKLLGDRIS